MKLETPKHKLMITQAKKEIELADHLLYVTFKVVDEAKFLIAITSHVIKSAQLALEALFEHERYWKRMEPYPKSFAIEISLYRQKLEKRYGFDIKFHRLLRKLLEIEKFDKESAVRFRRGNKYILTSGDYNMAILDLEHVKRYSNLTKNFVKKISIIIEGKNE